MIKEISALEKTKDAYTEYGAYVNSYRSIPDSRDGLKVVQRRILCTFKDAGSLGDLHSSPSIEGMVLKNYHPHGSAYGALVNMINEISPMLRGMGNFGADFRGFLEPVGAAASRYTKTGLSILGVNFIKLINYSENFINENDTEEPLYIPTYIPYCLINGSDGMGIGCATSIPSFRLDDLRDMAKDILLGNPVKKIIPYFGGGETIISEEELERLHNVGVCSLVVQSKYEVVKEKSDVHYIINDVPKSIVNLSKIKKFFKDEILNKEVILKNEIQSTIKIVLIKTKKCRLTEQKFEDKLKKAISGSSSFNILVSDNKVVRRFTPEMYVSNCIKHALEAYKRFINSKLVKLEEDKFFFENKERILEFLKMNLERKELKILMSKELDVSDSQIEKILSKSINSLIFSKKDVEKIDNDITNLKSDLNTLNKSFIRDFI